MENIGKSTLAGYGMDNCELERGGERMKQGKCYWRGESPGMLKGVTTPR